MNDGNVDNNNLPLPAAMLAAAGPTQQLAIESLEDYLQRYGLRPPDDNGSESAGELNGLNRTEARERIQAEKAYLDAFIEKHYHDGRRNTNQEEWDSDAKNGMIAILLANHERKVVSMKPMCTYCETVKRMTLHRSRFGVAAAGFHSDHDGDGDLDGDYVSETSSSREEQKVNAREDRELPLELSLVEFDADATLQFISALQSLFDHDHRQKTQHQRHQKNAATTHNIDMEGTRKCNRTSSSINLQNKEQTTLASSSSSPSTEQQQQQHIIHLIDTNQINNNSIIEIIKLSHFLQCNILLDTLVTIVESSIDLENCLSICCLADALNLTLLFESSVNFVIKRLDAFSGGCGIGVDDDDVVEDNAHDDDGKGKTEEEGVGDCDDEYSNNNIEEIWKSLPYDLRSRVLTMRNILRSSIIGRGSKMSGIFFSSGNEFLAIFRETIELQQERLTESRERLEEVIRERREEFNVKRQRRGVGRWFDSSVAAEEKFVYSADVEYSMQQIDRQAKRLTTLESFYREQQTIFSKCGNGNCKLSFVSR